MRERSDNISVPASGVLGAAASARQAEANEGETEDNAGNFGHRDDCDREDKSADQVIAIRHGSRRSREMSRT